MLVVILKHCSAAVFGFILEMPPLSEEVPCTALLNFRWLSSSVREQLIQEVKGLIAAASGGQPLLESAATEDARPARVFDASNSTWKAEAEPFALQAMQGWIGRELTVSRRRSFVLRGFSSAVHATVAEVAQHRHH